MKDRNSALGLPTLTPLGLRPNACTLLARQAVLFHADVTALHMALPTISVLQGLVFRPRNMLPDGFDASQMIAAADMLTVRPFELELTAQLAL